MADDTSEVRTGRVKEPTDLAASEPRLVRQNELGKLVREKRKADRLTLEEAARRTGISPATLWRLERQDSDRGRGAEKPLPQPDTRTIAAVTRWLGVPLDRFVEQSVTPTDGGVTHYEGDTTPDIVAAHLRADRKLDEEAAAALARMFRLAYEQFEQLRPTPGKGGTDEPEGPGDEDGRLSGSRKQRNEVDG